MSFYRPAIHSDQTILRCHYCPETRKTQEAMQLHYVEAHSSTDEANAAVELALIQTEGI